MDLALNNLQWLISHKNQTKPNQILPLNIQELADQQKHTVINSVKTLDTI